MIYYSLQSSLTLPLILLSHSSILLSLPYFSTSHTFLHTPRFFFLTSLSSPFVPYIHKESLENLIHAIIRMEWLQPLKRKTIENFKLGTRFFRFFQFFLFFHLLILTGGGLTHFCRSLRQRQQRHSIMFQGIFLEVSPK